MEQESKTLEKSLIEVGEKLDYLNGQFVEQEQSGGGQIPDELRTAAVTSIIELSDALQELTAKMEQAGRIDHEEAARIRCNAQRVKDNTTRYYAPIMG